MPCCNDSNDETLRATLAKVNKIAEVIGVDEWTEPAVMPASFIKENGKEPGEVKINNLSKLFEWYIQRFERLMSSLFFVST